MLHFFLILRYTMRMKAFTANKDILFTLHKLQNEILQYCNKDEILALPAFPLWAFCDDSFFEGTISACVIEKALHDRQKGKLYFPVIFTKEDGCQKTLRIEFANIQKEVSNLTLPQRQELPLKVNSFRTGTVSVNKCTWQLFDEKWFKIKN